MSKGHQETFSVTFLQSSEKTTSHAGTKSGCLLGACSHKGTLGFGPIR